jgi:hypothetical protein
MLNAAEAQIDATAKDDKERARLRSKIYAPPRGERGAARRRPAPTRMTQSSAKAFLAAAAAQDAQATRGDS